MSFKNKVVLITGGSAGIGAATAIKFAKEGATVGIVGRNADKLKSVEQSCKKYGVNTFAIEADLSKDQETDVVIKKTIEKFNKLDILVNNAGILREASVLSDKFLETHDEVMNINVRGAVRLTHFAAPYLIKTKGNIVNIASVSGKSTSRVDTASYRTSKAAMHHFTRCVALELAPHGVRVNSISPGPVWTDIFEGMQVTAEHLKKKTPLQKVSEPDEIADMILYVASDKAKSITGSDFVVDNGLLLVN